MLIIDGGYGEGGGQIVRTAAALSVLTKIPVKVINIRKNRKPPGLKPQHFTALSFLCKISNSKYSGIEIGSKEIEIHPKKVEGGVYNIDIGTAGSISLLLQAVLLPLLFANKRVELFIKGGTEVRHSPTIDYFRFVILHYVRRFADIYMEIKRRGYYPRGGGLVYISIKPKVKRDRYKRFSEFLLDLRRKISGYELYSKEPVKQIFIYSCASEDLRFRKVAERQVSYAKKVLSKEYDCEIVENIIYDRTLSTGSSITIVGLRENGIVFGSDALGERGKPAEKVGGEAAQKFIEYEKRGVIDNHLADNLVPYLFLVGGKMKTDKFTNHLITNIWVVEQFFGKIFGKDPERRLVWTVF